MPVTPSVGALQNWLATLPDEDRHLLRAATGLDTGSEVLPGGRAVGVAVSGGGDSMALLHMLADAAPHCGFTVEAATVDHRLRPEAEAEAAFVAGVCRARGLRHETLVWQAHPKSGNLMQAASEARRKLLADWALSRGLARVAMAHTLDDQAEGFLMALGRGTGLDGLCGMRRDWQEHGISFVRPLLGNSRTALRDYLERHGLEWREDPTNEDDRFARSRARKAMAVLAPLGIVPDRLNETMKNLADVRALLDQSLASFAERSVTLSGGALVLRRAQYLDLPFELRRRLLVAMIRWMSGARHPPRSEQVFALSMNIRDEGASMLGGCRFINDGKSIVVLREAAAVAQRVPTGTIWDHRWQVDSPFEPGQEIGALGAEGLRQCPDWRSTGLPRQVLEVTPGVWLGNTLIAAPCAGFGPATATCAPSFHAFLLSH